MSLQLYNTLSRTKEPFKPVVAGKVRMYCCGVTVYDYCHLGHARSYIVWDVIRRYLQWRGFDVQYVQNYTDIDDKILKRAIETDQAWQTVTETFIQAYEDDMARLNILPADAYPKATETIPAIIDLIQALETKGVAYAANGDVYYAVERFPGYGKLSGRLLDQMEAGASGRLDQGEQKKRHPLDFALWKAAKPGEPSWESPWGSGRPGWHIECSAMVQECLGPEIDIHAGGADLVFPHHENEIAQSEAALTPRLARYWMHNGFVNVGGEKMSKSLGNFTTIRNLLDTPLPILEEQTLDPMALRLFVLQAQYRKPIDFTDDAIAAAQQSWQTLKEGLLFGYDYGAQLQWSDCSDPAFGNPANMRIPDSSDAVQRFQLAMDDDFNSPGGLVVLFELAKDLRKVGNILRHQGETVSTPDQLREQWQTLVCLSQVLGLEAQPNAAADHRGGLSEQAIVALIEERQAARQAKNYADSDRIRDQLKAQGITLIDQPNGITRWLRE
ncbi:cysteine--tRNA ligase [Acaryochloris sp. IP29b_bin.137]|uniref:cysteine--tRNA ligase n=1 Tax=Acaryochloris sp. IP29b_bin.137 TaxID=2969217 RepID=UPI0026105A11|nr:cysteine--tRNA ligase [Acaryochloris sp. IP29b_bin.137]